MMGKSKSERTIVEAVGEYDDLGTDSNIRCIDVATVAESETLVYVGTEAGTLILLNLVCSGSDDDKVSLSRCKSVTVVSGCSVDAIHAFVEMGSVLLVSDGFLFIVDSLVLQPIRKLSFPRGGGVRCVAPRAAAASSTPSSSSRQHQSLLDKAADPSSTSCSFLAAVATSKNLTLIQIQPSAGSCVIVKQIQGVEGVLTMAWINNSIIFATLDAYSLFSCLTGQTTALFSLPPHPSSPPYLKSLSNHHALLLVDNLGILVNSLAQPIAASLLFHRPPHAIGQISPNFIAAVAHGTLDLYHYKSPSCLQSLSFTCQSLAPCSLATTPTTNPQLVLLASSNKLICFRVISAQQQIKDLLRTKCFKEAITLAEELEHEGEMTKQMLSFVHAQVGFLLLFDLHFEEAVNHFLQSDIMHPSEIFPFIMRDPNRWSMLVPRSRYWGLHPPPVPLEDVVDDGLMAIQRTIFLRKAGVETAADDQFILNPPSKADLLESAINSIIRYLEVSREKDLGVSVREGVDTLLMYLYRALNRVYDMEQLASSDNNCLVEELETLLDESGHLRALAFLYASKGMSLKALAIWRTLARQYSAGMWKDRSTENEPSNVICSQKTAAIEASKLLEESSNQDMVLQHLGWIADVDQDLAVQILTSEKRAVQLSPEEVISAIDSKKVEILQRYLQWLIEDRDSDDTQFHTLYALSLAKSSLEIVEKENPDGRFSEATDLSDIEGHTISRSSVRTRLQLFLQSSDLYDPEEVLDLIEESDLWLEKAILYRKLGHETLVLQIYALKLEDSEAAEQYCAEIGRQDAYMQLLDMYLDPQNGKEPMFKAAVRLLHKHGESLDPRHVLETLSPDMPLQLASDTILRMLRARVHHHCQGQIVHSLSRAINIDAKLARFEERSRHVQINDESFCDSCHARLGTKLFAMYPDDSIVCYKCFRRQGESISITRRNFKKNIIFKPGWLVND